MYLNCATVTCLLPKNTVSHLRHKLIVSMGLCLCNSSKPRCLPTLVTRTSCHHKNATNSRFLCLRWLALWLLCSSGRQVPHQTVLAEFPQLGSCRQQLGLPFYYLLDYLLLSTFLSWIFFRWDNLSSALLLCCFHICLYSPSCQVPSPIAHVRLALLTRACGLSASRPVTAFISS